MTDETNTPGDAPDPNAVVTPPIEAAAPVTPSDPPLASTPPSTQGDDATEPDDEALAGESAPVAALNSAGETDPYALSIDPTKPIVETDHVESGETDGDGNAVYIEKDVIVKPAEGDPGTFTRKFEVYRELSDHEVETYGAGTIREAQMTGLRPTNVTVGFTVDDAQYPEGTADADKAHTYVFVASSPETEASTDTEVSTEEDGAALG